MRLIEMTCFFQNSRELTSDKSYEQCKLKHIIKQIKQVHKNDLKQSLVDPAPKMEKEQKMPQINTHTHTQNKEQTVTTPYRPDKSCCPRSRSEATPWPIPARSPAPPALRPSPPAAAPCYRESLRTLGSTASAAELDWCTASSRSSCSRRMPRFLPPNRSVSATARPCRPPPSPAPGDLSRKKKKKNGRNRRRRESLNFGRKCEVESTKRELNSSWRVVGIAGLGRRILHERGERKWRFSSPFLARRQWRKRGVLILFTIFFFFITPSAYSFL